MEKLGQKAKPADEYMAIYNRIAREFGGLQGKEAHTTYGGWKNPVDWGGGEGERGLKLLVNDAIVCRREMK